MKNNKPFRVIVVNPKTKTITEEQVDGSFLDYLHNKVAPLVTVAGLTETEDGWVDDEGLINGTEHFIECTYYGQPLAGTMVIAGHDREGNSVSTKMSVDEVRANVKFLSLAEVAMRFR